MANQIRLEVILCKNKMYKKLCCKCEVPFLLIRAIAAFHRSPALPSPLSITRLYILFEQTINIIESFAFSPGEIYILAF